MCSYVRSFARYIGDFIYFVFYFVPVILLHIRWKRERKRQWNCKSSVILAEGHSTSIELCVHSRSKKKKERPCIFILGLFGANSFIFFLANWEKNRAHTRSQLAKASLCNFTFIRHFVSIFDDTKYRNARYGCNGDGGSNGNPM